MRKKLSIGLTFLLLFLGPHVFCQKSTISNPLRSLASINVHFRDGLQLKKTGNPAEALISFQKAMREIRLQNDNFSEITCLYWIGITELSQKDFPLSLKTFLKADSLLSISGNTHAYCLEVKYMKGLLYYKCSDLQKAYAIFEECVQKVKHVPGQDSTLARILARKGSIEYVQGNFTKAIRTYEEAKNRGISAFGNNSEFVADQLNALGVMNFMLARYDDALSFYMQSQKQIIQSRRSYTYGLATSYCNIALVFQIKTDYENALLFLKKALELYRTDQDDGQSSMTNVYVNMASTYQNMGNFSKQFENLNLSYYQATKYKTEALPKIYWMYATYYTNIKDFKKAEDYYKLSITANTKLFGEGPELAFILNNYGFFVENFLHHHDKAIKLFQQSLTFHLKYFGVHNPSTGLCYTNLGNACVAKNNLKKGLDYFQLALLSTSENDENTNINHHPDITQSLNDESFADILKAKASVFGKLAMNPCSAPEKLNYLKHQYENNVIAIQVIEKMRANYITEESRLYLSENELPLFQNAIMEAIHLYTLTLNKSYLNDSYAFTDNIHASSLQLGLKENRLPLNYKLSDSLATKEHALKKDLSVYHEFIIKEKISKHIDSVRLHRWEQQVSDLTLSIENVENLEKKANPVYYQVKLHQNPESQMKTIQNGLLQNEVLLEYFYTERQLFIYYIDKRHFQYKQLPLTSEFENDIEKVSAFIRQPKVTNSDAVFAINYKKAAWNLYNALLAPFANDIKGKNLIIIPYDKLTYIPFETLLTEKCEFKPLNFKELPYLLKCNKIRYAYAGNLAVANKISKPVPGNMAAFVPQYDKPDVVALNTTRHGTFTSLKKTEEECQSIKDYFPLKIFKSSYASEEKFKMESAKYGTLHLAMHSVIDDDNPMYSFLAFTPHSSVKEDDKLYTYEIYNLNLNVQLLVLSACNTGFGKLRKGEGMMSLTRGFAFAGVPSIITTLWSVNDNTSADLMKTFYKTLTTGKSKGEALNDAKQAYLHDADIIHAHPYYWAGFVLIGDNSPMKIQSNRSYDLWIAILIIVILSGYWLIRRRKLKNLTQLLSTITSATD